MKPIIPSFDSPPSKCLEDTAPAGEILAAAGRILSARRSSRRGPAKIEPCPACGLSTNARIRRAGCFCGHKWPVKDR